MGFERSGPASQVGSTDSAPRQQSPAPHALLQLQATAGNAAVQHLIGGPQQLARLRTAKGFKKRSSLTGRSRSQALKDVDASLASYDTLRNAGGAERETALYDLFGKIGAWKRSKATDDDKDAWKKSARAKYIKELDAEQDAEMQLAVALKNSEEQDKQAAALKAKVAQMDALISPSIAATKDPVAKARALFAAYMTKFRGKATYTTTTPKGTTVWDMKNSVACAMISNGLIDLLRHAGVTASLREIEPQNFITKKLGAGFIDPGTEGNVRLPGGAFASEKRFFFNKHWIVDVENGSLYLDPTSGIEVDKNASQIIEHRDFVAIEYEPLTYDNKTLTATRVGANALGDGAYELTES